MSEGALHRAFVAIGSNISPERNIPAAVAALGRVGRVTAVSTVWETAPVGFHEQPHFLNAAILLETELTAELLCRERVPRIEAELGRVRDPNNKNGPRTIDLDLVLFDHAVIEVDHRTIPDPEILDRPFLAVPLAELAAEHMHPVAKKTLAEIAATFPHSAIEAMKERPDVRLAEA